MPKELANVRLETYLHERVYSTEPKDFLNLLTAATDDVVATYLVLMRTEKPGLETTLHKYALDYANARRPQIDYERDYAKTVKELQKRIDNIKEQNHSSES
jgi:hypothetical protein